MQRLEVPPSDIHFDIHLQSVSSDQEFGCEGGLNA